MTTVGDYHVFQAGDVVLQSGAVFHSVRLAYKTYGTLNARKENAPGQPNFIPSRRSTVTVPEIRSTTPWTAPSSTPRFRRFCRPETDIS
jgi:hypothetical protein